MISNTIYNGHAGTTAGQEHEARQEAVVASGDRREEREYNQYSRIV
jgi:hypothetical protein